MLSGRGRGGRGGGQSGRSPIIQQRLTWCKQARTDDLVQTRERHPEANGEGGLRDAKRRPGASAPTHRGPCANVRRRIVVIVSVAATPRAGPPDASRQC